MVVGIEYRRRLVWICYGDGRREVGLIIPLFGVSSICSELFDETGGQGWIIHLLLT